LRDVPDARPNDVTCALVVDAEEEGDTYLRTRQRKLQPVRDAEAVSGPGYMYGRGKNQKGPGARPMKVRREAAVVQALKLANLLRHRQRAETLGPHKRMDPIACDASMTASSLRPLAVDEKSELRACGRCNVEARGPFEASGFVIGQVVQVRASGNRMWLRGKVVSILPLKMLPDRWCGEGFEWDEVRACKAFVDKGAVIHEERRERRVRLALRKHFATDQEKERSRARKAKNEAFEI